MPTKPTEWTDVSVNWNNPTDDDVLRLDVWWAIYLTAKERLRGAGELLPATTAKVLALQWRTKINNGEEFQPLTTLLELGEWIRIITQLTTEDDGLPGVYSNHTLGVDYTTLDYTQFDNTKWTANDLAIAIGESGSGDLINYTTNPFTALDDINATTGVLSDLKTVITQQYKLLNLLRKPRPPIDKDNSEYKQITGASSWANAESSFNSASWTSGSLPGLLNAAHYYQGSQSGGSYIKEANRWANYRSLTNYVYTDYDLVGDITYWTYLYAAGGTTFETIGTFNTTSKMNPSAVYNLTLGSGDTRIDLTESDLEIFIDSQLSSNNDPTSTTYNIDSRVGGSNITYSWFEWDLTGANGFNFKDW